MQIHWQTLISKTDTRHLVFVILIKLAAHFQSSHYLVVVVSREVIRQLVVWLTDVRTQLRLNDVSLTDFQLSDCGIRHTILLISYVVIKVWELTFTRLLTLKQNQSPPVTFTVSNFPKISSLGAN